jgi:rfaE bifunctional protein nucleotidyltransferase chain/domain
MKKYNLENLGKISKILKRKGKKIGLCHGVFDVLHAGHISHFEEVKKKCDYLFVTITEDKFVNKGPNRPVNNHYFRAKILESLRQVDYVAINFSSDATQSIRQIKPNFYFKGKDYKGKKDLTERLYKEIKEVKKVKSKIIYTESPLQSSTEIINKSFSYILDSKLTKFLEKKNKTKLLAQSIESLKKIENKKVLIIGDAIIDQYDTVKPLNKPLKESILATRYVKTDIFLGGIFAAATNLSQFNNNVSVCTLMGNDKDVKEPLKKFKKKIKSKIFYENKKVTTRKRRFVENAYNKKISEVYFMDDNLLGLKNKKKILSYLKKEISKFDAVILIDYGHGFIDNDIYNVLRQKAKFLAINCQTNSANLGFNLITKYPVSDFICIDEPELRLAASDNISEIEEIVKSQITKKIKCKNITITRGRNGSFSYSGSNVLNTPALISDKVIDTIGAGDVFLVITSLLYSTKSDQLVTNIIGNIAGALKVDILGHSKSISRSNFYAVLNHVLK